MNHRAIPITVVSGLLGSGKSTLIQHIISQKPAAETWAVLINEFGEIDIDGEVLQNMTQASSQIFVETVSGGCICCTAHIALVQAINEIFQKHTTLDRLIIEPTGLGHPAKIIDTLQQNNFTQKTKLQPPICILTPMQMTTERWQKSAVMRDLVTLADTIIINKTDLASDAQKQACQKLLSQLYPPKNHLIETQFAQVNLTDLFAPNTKATPGFKLLSATPTNHHQLKPHLATTEENYPSQIPHTEACFVYRHEPSISLETSKQSKPTIEENPMSIGWQWPQTTQFNRNRLKTFFEQMQPSLERAKGILKTGNEWQLVQWVDGECQFSDMAWRKDSRLELFFENTHNNLSPEAIETALMQTIHKY